MIIPIRRSFNWLSFIKHFGLSVRDTGKQLLRTIGYANLDTPLYITYDLSKSMATF